MNFFLPGAAQICRSAPVRNAPAGLSRSSPALARTLLLPYGVLAGAWEEHMVTRLLTALAFLVALPAAAPAAGVALVDASGTSHGTASLRLSSGVVQLKIKGMTPLPAAAVAPSGTFMATTYKAYISSSTDPGVEIFLTDLYPNAKLRAARRIALGGDVSHLGLDRIAVTAYSSNAQQSVDVLTASFVP